MTLEDRAMRALSTLHRVLTIGLFAGVAAIQITGMVGGFSLWSFAVLGAVIACGFVWMLRRVAWGQDYDHVSKRCAWCSSHMETANSILLLSGLILFACRVLFPMSVWPISSYASQLNWDTAAYHLPKAIDLWESGSLWNTDVPYWQYPSGYEGLLALSYLLTSSGSLLGVVHALIILYFAATVALLVLRYSDLPIGVVVWVLTLTFIFSPLRSTVFEFGKNDLLLAASCLAVWLYSPLGSVGWRRYDIPYLAASSGIALVTKPNCIPVLLVVWSATVWREFRQNRRQLKGVAIRFAAAGIVCVPSLLWVFRNLIRIGKVFSTDTLSQSSWSILGNVTNTSWFLAVRQQPGFRLLLFGIVFSAAYAVLGLRKRYARFPILLLLLVSLATFVVTPCSAWGNNSIQWRFGVVFLAALAVAVLCLVAPLILACLSVVQRSRVTVAALSVCTLIAVTGLLWRWRSHIQIYPERRTVLREWFLEPVGTDGYASAYDYVFRNIRDARIGLHGGLPFFLLGERFSNTLFGIPASGMCGGMNADYVVLFLPRQSIYEQFNPGKPRTLPAFTSDETWLSAWELVYEDPEGRVYRPRAPMPQPAESGAAGHPNAVP